MIEFLVLFYFQMYHTSDYRHELLCAVKWIEQHVTALQECNSNQDESNSDDYASATLTRKSTQKKKATKDVSNVKQTPLQTACLLLQNILKSLPEKKTDSTEVVNGFWFARRIFNCLFLCVRSKQSDGIVYVHIQIGEI